MSEKDIIENIAELLRNITDIESINKMLGSVGASARYVLINNTVEAIDSDTVGIIEDAKKNNIDEYQKYQQLKQEAIESHKHDMTPAKMIDVDKACTRVYSILLRMIAELNKRNEMLRESLNELRSSHALKECEWSDDNGIPNEQGQQDTVE